MPTAARLTGAFLVARDPGDVIVGIDGTSSGACAHSLRRRLGGVWDAVGPRCHGAREPDVGGRPISAGSANHLDRDAAASSVLCSQRLDHVDLVELTSVGGCGRVDAVANVPLPDVAEDVVPMLEEPFLVSP
jgi:hypothetical protein